MGDHQDGHAFPVLGFCHLFNYSSAFTIQGAGGFIHQQEVGLEQKRANDAQPLPLAHGERSSLVLKINPEESQPVQPASQLVIGGQVCSLLAAKP